MVSLGAVEMLVQSLWPEEHHAAVTVPDKRQGERIVLVTTATAPTPTRFGNYGKKAGAAELMVPDDIVKVARCRCSVPARPTTSAARRMALERLGLEAAA